jgi:hypothetical protein
MIELGSTLVAAVVVDIRWERYCREYSMGISFVAFEWSRESFLPAHD